MGSFVRGDVVITPFPFSDLTTAKRRPAVVVAPLQGQDVVLCQITSKTHWDPYAVLITAADFTSGSLHQDSHVRPNRLFTADGDIILYKAGALTDAKTQEIIARIVKIVTT